MQYSSTQMVELLLLLSTGGFTVPQRKVLSFFRRFSGIVSLISASLLIHMVLRKIRKNHSDAPTFHRFLLGLSIYDVLNETWLAIGVMAVPRDPIAGGYGAIGTRATCTAQGFFITLSMGSFIYNAGLSIYYVLVIRYGVTETTVARYLEPIFHLLALALPISFGVSGLISTVYNPPVYSPPEVGCFACPYPPMCVVTGYHTCERGRHFLRWMNAFYGTELLFIGLVVVMSAVLYWTVRTQYRSSSRYASRETEQMKRRVRAVACQAFLFALTCVNTGVWNYLALLAIHFHFPLPFFKAIVFSSIICFSSQGFLNFAIYTRPRYNRLRRRRPEIGRWGALMEVVFEKHSDDDNGQRAPSVLIKLFTCRRLPAQSSNQTVIERRRSLWMSSSTFGATNIDGTDRGRWETLMSVMIGEDNGSPPRRNSLVLLFRRRSTRKQSDSSDATSADPGSQQQHATNQHRPISALGTSLAQTIELATTTVCNTDGEQRLGDAPTAMEDVPHESDKISSEDVDKIILANDTTTLPGVSCERATMNLHVEPSDLDGHTKAPV